jgi:hypothetical protein
MRRSGWGPPKKDPPRGHLAGSRCALWRNLAEHVEKTVARHRGCWAQPAEPSPAVEPSTEPEVAPDPEHLAEQAAIARREASALVNRTRERYTAVQNLRAQGKGIKTIMRELGLAKETVRRFARATKVEDLIGEPHQDDQTADVGRAGFELLRKRVLLAS